MKTKLFKRTTALLSTAAMLLTCADFSAIDFSVHAESAPELTMYDVNCDGKIEDGEMAYKLDSADDLYWFAGLVNGTLKDVEQNTTASAYLDKDITVNSGVLNADGELNSAKAESFRKWDPIGNGLGLYGGSLFDGRGHTISGLYFNDDSKKRIGLFGEVFNFGKTTFKDINIADSYFCGYYSVGSICGLACSTTEIVNCSNSGRVTAGNGQCGGICGENSILKNCTNTGTISGYTAIGGIAGRNCFEMVSCTNTGKVTATSNFAGGICGLNYEGKIKSCTNTGDITGTDNIGGICGETLFSDISNCSNKGTVTGLKEIGGICGHNLENITILNCSNSGAVEGSGETGGICGYNFGTLKNCSNKGTVTCLDMIHPNIGGVCGFNKGLLTSCYNTADVVANANYVGGVCGSNFNEKKGVVGCYNSGKIIGVERVGGVCGDSNRGIVKECYNKGLITAKSLAGGICGTNNVLSQIIECYNLSDVKCSDETAGGICGYNNGLLTSCYNTADVTGTNYVGGVCGSNYNGYDNEDKLREGIVGCYNSGKIIGADRVGGVCGYSNYGVIKKCYNKGLITAESNVGGVCGVCGVNYDTIFKSYNTGSVQGNENVGDISGWNENGTIKNCYYLADTEDESGGKTAKQFASGEVCWLLNEEQSDSPDFYQNIGEDKSPSLDYSRHYVKYNAEKSEYYNEHDFSYTDCCPICLKLKEGCKATFMNCGLTLTDGIIMKYHVVVDDDFDTANSKVEFSLENGEKVEIPFSKAKKNENQNVYTFSLPLAPNLMKEYVTSKVIGSDGKALSEIKYSVSDYVDEVFKTFNYDVNMCNLAKAMLTYGDYAKAYCDDSDYASHYPQNYKISEDYNYTVNQNNKDLKIKSASLTLGSGVSIHLQYEVTDGKNYTFECSDSKKLRVEKNDNIYDVFLDGILPQDFSKMYKFTSSDGDTFTYSVFSYIKENLNSEKKSLTNLLNSMYEYNQAADAYLD